MHALIPGSCCCLLQGLQVDPDHLLLAAGCGALLDLYFHAVAGPGDGVLIPAPYYLAFDSDLRVSDAASLRRGRCCCCCCCNWLGGAAASLVEGMHGCSCAAALLRLTQQRTPCACACLPHAPLCQQLRDGVVPVPVHLDYEQPDFGPVLDAAAAAAAAQGHRVAALLLTHPHNPHGTLYSRQQLASMLAWCLRHKRHCLRCGSCGAPGSMHVAANTASMRCCSFS